MAEAAREEEVEYESDPEEAKLSLKMRRREASDDEEGESGCGDRENGEGTDGTKTRRRIVDSDVESDGQGAPADYEDEEDEDYAEEEEEEEEEVDDELIENADYVEDLEVEYEDGRGGEIGGVAAGAAKGELLVPLGGEESLEDRVGPKPRGGLDGSNDVPNFDGISKGNQQGDEEVEGQDEEKEENEPYAVPTAGAFYMHDDRFRENSGGRHRRTFGGKKLWESKDGKKWGHDKFEELTLQDRHFDEGRRNSRGRYRAHGWNRGAERGGYVQGNRPRSYNSGKSQSKNNIQINAPKSVRGRGPRRYQPSFKNNDEVPAMPSQQSGKVAEKSSNSSYGRVSAPNSNVESEAAPAKKHVFASSLSSASPPFYPSTSASKEIPISQKRDVQPGVSNRWIHPSAVDQNISTAQSTAVRRGKTVVDSVGMDKLYIDDSVSSVSGKPSTPLQFPSGSSSVSSSQSLQSQINYQSTGPNNQVNRISPCTQLNAAKKNPAQSRGHLSLQASSQQFTQNPGSGSQASSPPKAALRKSSFEPVEKDPPSELSKSKAASVVKGKCGIQGNGRGSFLYGGAQVMGASGTLGGGHGDQNFPAFLPVMQFGGQHPGGIGVPAVGMAFPGYVGQPQLGLGNSEMTWLPVLAGAAGALGATYRSPYMSVDGSYNIRPSGPASSVAAASIKENNTADKHSNEWNPAQRSEVANDDFGQRQKNSRRYTEMKFDQ